MSGRTSSFERSTVTMALLALMAFLYLLYDDSFLTEWGSVKTPRIGQIESPANDVRQKHAGRFEWRRLRSLRPLHDGDSVFTGEGSSARVSLRDGTVLEVQANSLIVFDLRDGRFVPELRFGDVKVLAGSLKIEKPAPAPVPRLPTSLPRPTSITWLFPGHAERFLIPVNEERIPYESPKITVKWKSEPPHSAYELQFATAEKFLSATEVSGTEWQSPDLPPGDYRVRLRPKQAGPTPWSETLAFSVVYQLPEALPAPLLKIKPAAEIPLLAKAVWEWHPVPGAIQYVVELSKDASFQKIEQKVAVSQSRFELSAARAGDYHLRVFGLSALERAGAVAVFPPTRAVLTKPVIEPVEAVVRQGENHRSRPEAVDVEIRWSVFDGAVKSLLEISKTEDFKEPEKIEVTGRSHSLKLSEAGRSFVRVRGLNAKGQAITAVSEAVPVVYEFRLPRELEKPQVTEPAKHMTLFFQSMRSTPFWIEWKAVPAAVSYQVEISTRKDFREKMESLRTEEQRVRIQQKLPQGTIYWRVKALGSGGEESSWSEGSISVFAGRQRAKSPKN